MRRRSVLAGIAAAIGVGTAGCTGSSGGSGGGADTDEPTATPTPPPTDAAPTMGDRNLRRIDACPDDATVSFDADASAVSMRGCVTGQNGCSEPSMTDAAYDAAADSLQVVVGTVEETDGETVCTQALTSRGYEATVSFEGGMPGSVTVVHDDAEGRREAVTATQ